MVIWLARSWGKLTRSAVRTPSPRQRNTWARGVSALEKGSSRDKGHGHNKDGRRDDRRDSSRISKEKGKDDETQMALKLMAQLIAQLSGNLTKFMASPET